jgi:hypothetical protein
MKEVHYFSHDAFARHDKNIAAMLSVYGMQGYGIYWCLMELMREREECDFRVGISGKYDFITLCKETGVKENKMKKFIDDCIQEFQLFKSDGETVWSEDMLTRMAIMKEKSEQGRSAARKRWGTELPNVSSHGQERHADALPMHNGRTARAMPIKETKQEEKKQEIKREKMKVSKAEESARRSGLTPQPTGASAQEDPDYDPIGIENEPHDEDLRWYKSEHFFVDTNFRDQLMAQYGRTSDEVWRILESHRNDYYLPNHRGDFKSYVKDCIALIPFVY